MNGTSIQDLSQQYYDNNNMQREVLPPNQLNIEDLAKDINDNLNDDILESIIDDDNNTNAPASNQFSTSYIINLLKDPLIILVIFIILSQPFVKNTIGTYITQINPNADGQVSLTGVIIYGLILVGLFMIVRQVV